MVVKTNNKFYHLLRALRPRQWIKNGLLFAPLIFGGYLLNYDYFMQTFYAFLYFCGIASAIYLLNDIWDVEKDRLHPIKKNRPIASGALPISWAAVVSSLLVVILVPASFIYIGKYFGVIVSIYIIIQIAYNLKLKEVIILDALTIAFGFILRVFAGALAIPLSISSWLILAITGTSLLLAFGKRRAERTLLKARGLDNESTRAILKHYPDSLLDSMISTSASFAIITYSLFTFQTSSQSVTAGLIESLLPSTLTSAKYLMLTIPIVIYAVARYLYVIYEKGEGESPERIILKDKPLLYTSLVWLLLIIVIQTDFSSFYLGE